MVRGEIDNRVKGRIVGRIWLAGREEPIQLDLTGNCHQDMAGCLLRFVNENPGLDEPADLNAVQQGVAGDMTCSKKVRMVDLPQEKFAEKFELNTNPELSGKLGICVFLEWFSSTNGRVVIESLDFKTELSERMWNMNADAQLQQIQENQRAARDLMNQVNDYFEESGGEDFMADEPYEPMNEFEWEKHLKESDALTEKYSAVFEKYVDHPERDLMIAREMGWTWLVDALEGQSGQADVFDEEEELDLDDIPPLEPNPMTEGTDWVRGQNGRISHPLTERAFNIAMDMWHHCDDLGYLGENGDRDLHEMIFQAQTLSAKLAGALNGLAYDTEIEGGFIVACLKRALVFLNGSISAAGNVRTRSLIEENRLNEFCRQLFSIREDMLGLMDRFRNQKF
ncbi:MAG: hypothetical protein AAF492_03610 [Verrucomicrobiota bacterium]